MGKQGNAQRRHYAKLTRPHVEGTQVRPRLEERFQSIPDGGLMWIWAPAGSGKTTLTSSVIAKQTSDCLWYLLDQSDADLTSFYNKMALCVEELAGGTQEIVAHLGASQTSNPEALARSFFQDAFARLPAGTWVVLDDAQEFATSESLQATLRGLVSVIPDHVKVVILSRNAPPSFTARLALSRKFSQIKSEQLRFSEAETIALVASLCGGMANVARAQKMHSVTQGWAAAIVLLSLTPLEELSANASTENSPLVDYLGEEFYLRLGLEEQQFLTHTAVVDSLTPQLAEVLSGDRSAEERLASFCQQNFLIQHHPSTDHYQYHSLLREFLLERCPDKPDEKLRQRWTKGASLLEREGRIDSAASLLLRAGNHKKLASLIETHAGAIIADGRWQSLSALIVRFQEIGSLEKAPWVRYWLGACQLNTDTAAARDSFTKAYSQFLSTADFNKVGVYLSWARIVESFFLESGDFSELDHWIDEYRRIRPDLGMSLSKEVLGRVSVSLFNALVFLHPADPQLPKLERRLRWLLRLAPNLDVRVMLAAYLMRYYIYKGDLSSCEAVAQRMEVQLETARVSPLVKSAWLTIASTHAWISRSPEAGLAATEESLDAIESSGIRAFEFTTLAQGIYASIGLGDWNRANAYLERIAQFVKPERRMDLGQYLYLAGWLALAKGDMLAGVGYMRESEAAAKETGSPYVMGRGANGLAQAYLLSGDYEKAQVFLDVASEYIVPGGFDSITYRIDMARAQLAYAQGQLVKGHKELRVALALGRKANFGKMALWLPKDLAILCGRALEQGIEEEYVRDLVRIQHLSPPKGAGASWPWPVYIGQDDGLELQLFGKRFDTENPKVRRPIELLECLVALGGTSVPLEKLCDRLWPESEGDKASASLKVNLNRLRRLLPANAVLLSQGQLSMNRELVWIEKTP